ncbi:MAG: DUF4386 domain-containing protein [Saprospiraceae bacterium]
MKNAARIVGVLFLLQMITAVISHSVILAPILYGENFLVELSANSTKVKFAMLSDLICGASVFGIAVILFPILKKHSERIALWYVGLRLNEWVIATISGIFLLTLLAISKEHVQEGMPESSYLLTLGKYLLKARGATQNLGLIGFCLSASMFYYLLFTSRLVPRFISIWGLIGVLLLFTEILSSIFGHSLGGIIIMLPMGFNEIFLGFWLIAKGFKHL